MAMENKIIPLEKAMACSQMEEKTKKLQEKLELFYARMMV